MTVYYHNQKKIYYTKASHSAGLCWLCHEDIRYKNLIVRDKGFTAHFRCAYPEAYAARKAWVEANAGGAPVEVRHSDRLKRVRVV